MFVFTTWSTRSSTEHVRSCKPLPGVSFSSGLGPDLLMDHVVFPFALPGGMPPVSVTAWQGIAFVSGQPRRQARAGQSSLPIVLNVQGQPFIDKICFPERTCRLKPLLPSCNHGFLTVARSLLKLGAVRQVWQVLCMSGNADCNLRGQKMSAECVDGMAGLVLHCRLSCWLQGYVHA